MREFIQDNKNLIDEKGLKMWLVVWLKILGYGLVPPFILTLLIIAKWYFIAAIWLIPSFVMYGILFGGNRFVLWLSSKFIKIRNWFYK